MTKIVSLESENVMRIKAVHIQPNGRNVVIIGGDNANGKSSVLQSIAMLFGGAAEIPETPVRVGEEKAKIIAKLDNGIVVRRTFTKAGGTALVVESADGARYPSPQSIMDALTGKLMFDPLAFVKLDPAKQKTALQTLVGLDFTEINETRAKVYQERTLINRHLDHVRARLATMTHHEDAPAEEVSTAGLLAELEDAQKHNEEKESLGRAIKAAAAKLQLRRDGAAAQRAKIQALENELREARALLPKFDEDVKQAGIEHDAAIQADWEFKAIDLAPLRAAVANASETNRKVAENKVRADAVAALEKHTAEAAQATKAIADCDAAKEKALSEANFPIDGLAFDDNGVTYNGIPFSQASSAEQLRVSVAMGAALNPKLRVMLVRDGSLLDERSLQLLGDLAKEHDLQVFVERVGKADSSAIIIEDGTVASEPTPEPAEQEQASFAV